MLAVWFIVLVQLRSELASSHGVLPVLRFKKYGNRFTWDAKRTTDSLLE